MCAAPVARRSIRPSSTRLARRHCAGSSISRRSRCRCRPQRRAATRGVFSLRPAPDERFRQQLAALAARRCRTLSASQATDGANARRARGCGNYQPPKAIGEVRYVDDTELNAEIADFRTALEAKPNGFVEPFMTAPSPGIIAAAMKNEYYDSEEAYLAAVAAAIQIEYEAIVESGFLLQLDCPDLALERHLTYNDRPIGQFLAFVERGIAATNKAIVNVPCDPR